jgi:HAD superfamily hydrolase (TIGR01509 family)
MDPALPRPPRPFRLEAVLLDFDGTLTRPEALDFDAIKREIGCPLDEYVLEFIEALPAGERRELAAAALARFELEGAAASVPNEGAEEAVRRLRRHGLKVGVITRNGREAVDVALARFERLTAADFDVIVTRDDPVRFKPAPDGLLYAAEHMGVAPGRMLMVGDFVLDLIAGRHAGCVTVYLTNGGAPGSWDSEQACPEDEACDFVIDGLAELEGIVRLGLPLAQGKLPAELLAGYLDDLVVDDPAILVGAALGEDVAALDIEDAEVLVAHGDPITLTTADLGRYAVTVNANDIATSGAEPRWLLATVLLPAGSSAAEALHLLDDIAATCREQGIVPLGGHTEITAAVAQPLVSGTMLGVVRRADLRDKRDAREGDRVVLTKALAVEGTAVLAAELGERLLDLGMDEGELARCRAFAARLSVVSEARIAAGFAGVRAMHDVTEGGLATALVELSVACRSKLAVDRSAVPVFAETARLCALLGVDPLGLIGSGSLLICCDPDESDALLEALRAAGIEATEIGALGRPGAGVTARADGRPAEWPAFAVDEAARLLADR